MEVANETIMNSSDVTQEYVNEDMMYSSEDHQVNHGQENETTNLHLQNISRCEEGTTRETEVTISQETPDQEVETPLPLFDPPAMTTGMRVADLVGFGDELDTSDLCEINVPHYNFSEIVDEVLNDNAGNVGLLESIDTFTNTCRSLGASRRLTFTNLDDSVAANKKVHVQCQLKGVPKMKDIKKVKKGKGNRRGKGY